MADIGEPLRRHDDVPLTLPAFPPDPERLPAAPAEPLPVEQPEPLVPA